MILNKIAMMKFFDYIFYRSYINLYKTKHKNNAETRSIGLVTFLQGIILGVSEMILKKKFNLNSYNLYKSIELIFVLPFVFIVWYFNDKYYKKFSENNYQKLRTRFDKSSFNKIIPFWIIFILPFVLLFGVPFILSLFNRTN